MIYEKLFKVQSEVNRLKKDKRNPHFKNSYVDINSVLDELQPLLHDNKILMMQPLRVENGSNVLQTRLVDIEDNTEMLQEMYLPEKLDAQKTGSALTYFRRYELISLFGLQTVDDDGKVGSSPIKENTSPSQEQVLDLESLFAGKPEYRSQWLNFLNVSSFEKASKADIEKAIKQVGSES